jgi:hypothetical protein
MKTRFLVLGILLIVVMVPSMPATGGKDGTIKESQLFLSGVTIGSKESVVQEIFGPVLEVKETPGDPSEQSGRLLSFDGVQITLVDGEVHHLKCSVDKYSTRDGLKVGDSLSKAVSKYGQGSRIVREDECLLSYPVPETEKYLVLHFKGNRLVLIELWFDHA